MKRFILLLAFINSYIIVNAKFIFEYVNINEEDKTCYVYPSGTYYGRVVIPETVEIDNREGVYTVIGIETAGNGIGGAAYENEITEIILPPTLKVIGSCTFKACKKLTKIELPNGLTKIGDYAFSGSGIEEITIPNSVTEIGAKAFYGCKKLKNVYIGNGIKELGNAEFLVCDLIEKVFIGSGLEKISAGCFKAGGGWFAPKTLTILSTNIDPQSTFIDAETIYVPNPEHYAEILPTYSNLFKPIAELSVGEPIVYTGLSPVPSVKSDLGDICISINKNELPFDAGRHAETMNVSVSNNGWGGTIQLPCTYTISKAPLTIYANNMSKYYGEDDPSFEYTGIGFVNDETSEVLIKQPILTTTATSESDAGTYPIIVSGAEAKNYEISYEKGTLTILKAPQTITWEPNFEEASIGNMIELSATASSGLDVKFKSLDMSTAIITVNNGKSYIYPIKEGTVVIAAYQDGDKNHEAADEVYNVLRISSSTGIADVKENHRIIMYDIYGRIANSNTKGIKVLKDSTGKFRKVL